MIRKTFLFLFAAMAFLTYSTGEIKLPAIIGDNMVLQQKTQATVWGWAEKNKSVTIKTSWNNKTYTTTADGEGRWKQAVTTIEAGGGPYEISISDGKEIKIKNVLLGEVWLCSGQSNMEMPMYGFGGGQFTEGAQEFIATANPSRPIRMAQLTREYSSTPLEDCKTKWMVNNPEAVSQISATAYFFADYIQKTLQIPVGIIVSSWGGSNIETWIDKETLDKTISGIDYSFLNDPEAQKRNPNQRPTLLYNAMIMPIKNYTIQGVIWYQGESNIGNYQKYPALQKAMVEKWRSLFNNPDMPYLYTQIAPYIYSNGENRESAFQQEAQAKSLAEISNSGMAVTVDIGELTCIHPAKKREVGERLAYWALAETYDIAGINYKSPSYVSMQIKNDTINVAFDECDRGLYYGPGREETIIGFEIAGEDKIFHPAIAKIRGKEIEVKSPDVASPVAVRYCFKNYQPGYIYNNAGLPVAPFRTDNWEK